MNKLPVLMLSSALALLPALASAEVVVVASSQSPLSTLSKEQVAQVFLGKAKSINGHPVKPVEYIGAPKAQFWDTWLRKSSEQLTLEYAKLQFTGLGGPPKQVESLAEAKKAAAADPAVVFFLDATQMDSSLKQLAP